MKVKCLMCVMLVLVNYTAVQGNTLMKRIRNRQNADDAAIIVQQDRDSVQEVLLSIDDRLARLDASMDQLARRLDSKLGRLETKFDLRMSRVEEAVMGWELTSEQVSRRLDALGDKIAQRTAHLDIRVAKSLSRLDSLERDLHSSVDEILDRLVKGEEKSTIIEVEVAKVQERTVALGASIDREIARNFDKMDIQVGELMATTNTTSRTLVDLLGSTETTLTLVRETEERIDNLSTSCRQITREGRSGAGSVVTREQMDNLTAVFSQALTTHEAKFKELDSDVEMYTRKVVGGLQELWRTSDGLKADLSDALKLGGRTRELVREEFRRLHEKIEPLPRMEPRLTDISEDLDRKVVELSATVDSSFAAMLVAQNTFIASCQRVQEEETHVYDILQLMVYEMRNRSASDTGAITAELKALGSDIGKLADHLADRECIELRNASATEKTPVLYDAEVREELKTLVLDIGRLADQLADKGCIEGRNASIAEAPALYDAEESFDVRDKIGGAGQEYDMDYQLSEAY